MAEPQFLTIPEFCAEYRTSRSNVFVLLRDGRLKGIKVGKMTRIRRRDAQAWAAALPPAGRSKRKSEPKPLQDPPDQAAQSRHPVARPKRKPKLQRQRLEIEAAPAAMERGGAAAKRDSREMAKPAAKEKNKGKQSKRKLTARPAADSLPPKGTRPATG